MEVRRQAPALPPKPRRPPSAPLPGASLNKPLSPSPAPSLPSKHRSPAGDLPPAPLVPVSCLVGGPREPSYSTALPSAGTPNLYTNERLYANERHFSNDRHPPPTERLYANERLYNNVGHANTNLVAHPQQPPPPLGSTAPPSPVSSSYSELRRAAERPDCGGYNSSAYESLYEPVYPRPPSQLSAHSGSAYSVCGGRTAPGGASSASAQVDALTELMMCSLSDSKDADVYGTCAQCGEKIIGESSGCTAMDKLYHIRCFVCCKCAVNLQGKPFYAHNGKPHCKEDYFNTLEKCSVCTEPILDRILRATGKPYHPACFTCVVCGQSLDGIPFTVDATNRVHCIEDFHKKFAPRCCVCNRPIISESGQKGTVRVVALDRSFHVECYKCVDCGLILSSEAEGRGCYPLDGVVLCKSCNAERVKALTDRI